MLYVISSSSNSNTYILSWQLTLHIQEARRKEERGRWVRLSTLRLIAHIVEIKLQFEERERAKGKGSMEKEGG